MKPWYINAITGMPIYAARIGRIRHFTEMDPLPGALTRCSLPLGDDFAASLDVDTTCDICALRACEERMPADPPMDATAAQTFMEAI